ncbi:MAG TPA: hypothetical protein DDY12_10985 [Porphyromonadaceae bacterium]|nr:hypothetical protein [Porphyromonadaceae bacterium]
MAAPRFQQYNVITTDCNPFAEPLCFKRITLDDIPAINAVLCDAAWVSSRTCDYSIGGIFMWIDYFDYSYCIVNNTLFIKGVTENDVTTPAFSLPVGEMNLGAAVALLREYCAAHGNMSLKFSAVPEDRVEELRQLGATLVEPLEDWSDYIYDASSLASLSGKKLSKKRNHVNRFVTDNPGYRFEPLTHGNLDDVKAFFDASHLAFDKPVLADVERIQVKAVLDNFDCFPMMEGAVLSTIAEGIVAFTIGEIIGDTLYVHIEKMNHSVPGAGETVNNLFAKLILERHPEVRYINREEDTGDCGLRKAKLSYHPLALLKKFNVLM